MAYVKNIYPSSTDSHQTSPAYCLTFVRWDNRSTYNYTGDSLKTRKPLVVYNDAIRVTVNNSKSSPRSNCSITLKGGDLNYSTAVHPGDFVFVNMLNWETAAEKIRDIAASEGAINRTNHGFKGFFKIESVERNISVARNGAKTITYEVTALGFTEFETKVYYNPAIAAQFRQQGTLLYSTLIGEYFETMIKSQPELQKIVPLLFQAFIGPAVRDTLKIKKFGDKQFKIPKLVAKLLGNSTATHASHIFNYIIGTWGNGSSNSTNIATGFNDSIGVTSDSEFGDNFYKVDSDIKGATFNLTENWNNRSVWDIVKSHSNDVLNEMYTTYRVDPDGYVMPTVVVRQRPFNNNHFTAPSGYTITKFLSIPRWKISPNLIINAKLGRTNAKRVNFVQVFTRSLAATASLDMASQIAEENFEFDGDDIQRNGMRPLIRTSNFDFKGLAEKKINAKPWTKIVSDWYLDGHLKESGVITCAGIQDPISVGDNIEFDNIVYQIDAISHNIAIGANGNKTFRTTLQVSYGIDKRSNSTKPIYSQMEHTDYHTELEDDWERNRILPGFGEDQNIRGRENGVEIKKTPEQSFHGTAKPKDRISTDEKSGIVEKPDDESDAPFTKSGNYKLPF